MTKKQKRFSLFGWLSPILVLMSMLIGYMSYDVLSDEPYAGIIPTPEEENELREITPRLDKIEREILKTKCEDNGGTYRVYHGFPSSRFDTRNCRIGDKEYYERGLNWEHRETIRL